MRRHRRVRLGVRVLVAAALVGAWVTAASVSPAESAPAGRASGCESSASPGVSIQTIDVEGAARQYRLAMPSEPTGKQPRPLILNFHGSGRDDVTQANYSQLEEKGPARGFVVITPKAGSPAFWVAAQPELRAVTDVNLAFTTALIHNAKASLCIDTKRIYATGFSNGAAMSAYLGCTLGRQLAAIAPVSGVNLVAPCPNGKPMSVVALHGTADPEVAYEGGPGVLAGRPDSGLPSVETAVQAWAQRADCRTKPVRKSIGTQVERIAYRGCGSAADVVLYKVKNGAHNWPGSFELDDLGLPTQDINAADLILDFFAHHPPSKNAK
jgi:polyhydroxybutyrate depolymerase